MSFVRVGVVWCRATVQRAFPPCCVCCCQCRFPSHSWGDSTRASIRWPIRAQPLPSLGYLIGSGSRVSPASKANHSLAICTQTLNFTTKTAKIKQIRSDSSQGRTRADPPRRPGGNRRPSVRCRRAASRCRSRPPEKDGDGPEQSFAGVTWILAASFAACPHRCCCIALWGCFGARGSDCCCCCCCWGWLSKKNS